MPLAWNGSTAGNQNNLGKVGGVTVQLYGKPVEGL